MFNHDIISRAVIICGSAFVAINTEASTQHFNGKKISERPYGYSPFYFDITEYLRPVGQMNKVMTCKGHCLIIVQATKESGEVVVSAKSDGCSAASIRLNVTE